jgi:hypothetical protein
MAYGRRSRVRWTWAAVAVGLAAWVACSPDPIDADPVDETDVALDSDPLEDTDEIAFGNETGVSDTDPPPDTDVPAAPTFSVHIAPYLDVNCRPCHYPTLSGGLTFDGRYDGLVNQPSHGAPMLYVTPGDPELSYLWHKLRGTQITAGGMGVRMPKGYPLMSRSDRALFRRWITQGAVP